MDNTLRGIEEKEQNNKQLKQIAIRWKHRNLKKKKNLGRNIRLGGIEDGENVEEAREKITSTLEKIGGNININTETEELRRRGLFIR